MQKKRKAKTNIFSILSLIFAFLLAPLGLIFGIIALVQIKNKKQKGKGLAISGIVIGTIIVLFFVINLVTLLINVVQDPLYIIKEIEIDFEGTDYIKNNQSLKQVTINSLEESGIDANQLEQEYGHPCVSVVDWNRDINFYCFDELSLDETINTLKKTAEKSFNIFPELQSGFLHLNVICVIEHESGALIPQQGRTQVVYKNGEIIYESDRKQTCVKTTSELQPDLADFIKTK